jgi:purine-binding chemotaxis protein CheW
MSGLHVVFKVGDGDYVLPASDIVQMESFTTATQIPGAPPHVAGLVQIRGRVIPVIDLRARFGLPDAPRTLDSRVIVVQNGQRHVGLLADSAREVVRIGEDQFHAPPDVIATQSEGFVRSIAQAGNRIVMRVDFEKIIGHDAIEKEQIHGEQA